MNKRSMDLTQGSIVKVILSFALPIFVGQVFQNLYNSVDAVVVGRYVGTTALAAVTSCSDIALMLTGFFTGLATGSGVLFSRHFGAKDYQKLHDSIHTAITFSVLLGLVMAGIGIIATPLLLKITDCPPEVYDEASVYLRIYLVGILFTSVYNVGSGVLRAVGDSRSPFIYLVIASVINIVLDLLLVAALGMQVEGVAIATIVSQMTSVALVFRRMMTTTDVYRLKLRDLKMDRKIVLQVMDLGLPAAVQSSLIAVSNLFVQRYINAFGASAMAGIGAAKKIDKFEGLISQSLGLATTTFVSQNVGAKRIDRAYDGIKTCLKIALASVVVMGVVIYFNAEFFVRLFTDDESAMSFGVAMIHCMVPLYFLQSIFQVVSNAVRGFGHSRMVMIFSMTGMIGIRQVFLAISMNLNHDVRNVYFGYPVGWAGAAIMVVAYFFIVVYRENKRNASQHSSN